MEASPARIIQYFNGEKQNLIPLFQRPYTWSWEKWQTLWEDIMVQYDMGDASTHFLGAIVSLPARSVPVGVSKYLIIDGQQRLTTLSILLCALRDCLDENSAARIQEVYLTNRFREPEDTLKFVPTQADRDTYRAIVIDKQLPDSDHQMVAAYRYFKSLLTNEEDPNGDPVDLARVLATLEHSLQVVMINLGDSDDPYLIFESLNFKGEPLTQADLVRNYVLMRFKHSISAGGEQERIFTRYWQPLEHELGVNLTEFLRHYSMRDGDNTRQGGIYAATKARLKTMDTPEKVEAETCQMKTFGHLYATILDPEREQDQNVRTRLEHIRQLEVRTSYPLLLRFLGARASGYVVAHDLEKCFGLIESFVVRRAVCSVPTNALNKLFLQWTKNFPDSNHFKWLHESMSSGGGGRRFPTDSEFEDNFKNQSLYGRPVTRFMLCGLEHDIGHKEPVDLSSATIEHILPQTLTSEWCLQLGDQPEVTHGRLLHKIGNLTLTGYNAELGNIPFDEKKAKLANTHVELNRWILEQPSWGETEISNRANILFQRAKLLWTGPTMGS